MSHGPPLLTQWTSEGVPWEVSTTHEEPETEPEWHARHDAAVRYVQSLHPPDP